MKVRLDNILKPKEWIILAGGLLLAGIVYALMIHPSLKSLAELDQARSTKRRVEKKLAEAQEKLLNLRKQIDDGQKQLTAIGGSPPLASEKDLQIARVTALASQCDIIIDRYSPIGTTEHEAHQSIYVQFAAKSSFLSIQRFLSRVESELDFVDITHFRITSLNRGKTAKPDMNTDMDCLITWSCQINGMMLETPGQKPMVQSNAHYNTLMGVALHEP